MKEALMHCIPKTKIRITANDEMKNISLVAKLLWFEH